MRWKEIQRFGGRYSVSSEGEIRNNKTKRILRLYRNPRGYLRVSVSPSGRRGKSYCLNVAREVATAFIENPDNKPEVNHIDGNKENNRVENLEWVTAKQNMEHAYRLGLIAPQRGERHGNAKLKDEDVAYILKNYKPRCSIFGSRALGRKFGVDHMQVLRALKRT